MKTLQVKPVPQPSVDRIQIEMDVATARALLKLVGAIYIGNDGESIEVEKSARPAEIRPHTNVVWGTLYDYFNHAK